jgi:toxin-antitoxin system PIN domain toxin
MTYFPDVNVWVALAVGEHSNARQAQDWADEVSRDWIVLNRITQMSLLRLLTNPHALRPGRHERYWRRGTSFDELLERPNIRFVKEPDGVQEEIWRTLTSGTVSANSSWTDAYLAAFARTTGFTLVNVRSRIFPVSQYSVANSRRSVELWRQVPSLPCPKAGWEFAPRS